MTLWYCDSRCKISTGGAGPWDDGDSRFFVKIKLAHISCIGFQNKKPKLKGKANWGHTEIEKEATFVLNQNIHRLLHELIFELKGSSKVCLKDKSNEVNQP